MLLAVFGLSNASLAPLDYICIAASYLAFLMPFILTMNLIEASKRKELLLQAGFSQVLLDAIDRVDLIDERLSNIIKYPSGAYFYLPKIKNYSIFQGYNVVPICDAGQGDSFYTLLFNDAEKNIIFSEIEQDEIYADFGLNMNAVIITALMEYYDLMDDEEVEDRKAVIDKISELGSNFGLDKNTVAMVMKRIFKAEDDQEDRFTNARSWFEHEIMPCIS